MSDASNENLIALVNEQLQAIGHKNRKLKELREILRTAIEASKEAQKFGVVNTCLNFDQTALVSHLTLALLRAGEVLGVD